MSGGSVGVAAMPCPSVSDSASSSSTSWMVGVTSEGGRDVFFFFRFFLRRLSVLCTLLRRRWGRGRWVDKGWCVWWNVCLWSALKRRRNKNKSASWYQVWSLRLLTVDVCHALSLWISGAAALNMREACRWYFCELTLLFYWYETKLTLIILELSSGWGDHYGCLSFWATLHISACLKCSSK